MIVEAEGKRYSIPERNANLIRGQLNANCESCETIKPVVVAKKVKQPEAPKAKKTKPKATQPKTKK